MRASLRSYGSCVVAYSGGVDSAFLACVAHQVLGDKALAAIADTPSLPRRELADALALAEKFRFPVRVRHHELRVSVPQTPPAEAAVRVGLAALRLAPAAGSALVAHLARI